MLVLSYSIDWWPNVRLYPQVLFRHWQWSQHTWVVYVKVVKLHRLLLRSWYHALPKLRCDRRRWTGLAKQLLRREAIDRLPKFRMLQREQQQIREEQRQIREEQRSIQEAMQYAENRSRPDPRAATAQPAA